MISKFRELSKIVVLNKFLNKKKCPLDEIGKGSVIPWINPKIKQII